MIPACKVDGICNHSHWTATVNWDALGLLMKLEYRSYIIWDDFFES
jgi:hypothetical protein